MTRKEALQWAEGVLASAGIEEARTDARFLLMGLTNLTSAQLYFDGEKALPPLQYESYQDAIWRRAKHVPLQYITGEQEFMGLPFSVSPAVLIPRQDTECLVEAALPYCAGARVLDLCTGSGCILLSLAKLCGLRAAVGVDLSEEALKVAQKNARALGVEAELIQSDLFAKVTGKYDVIVSNPPYIRTGQIAALMPEVRDYEPRMALDGDEDGLHFYRKIATEAGKYLEKGGRIFFEIGCEQAREVKKILLENNFVEVFIRKDYAGLDRVAGGRFFPEERGKKPGCAT